MATIVDNIDNRNCRGRHHLRNKECPTIDRKHLTKAFLTTSENYTSAPESTTQVPGSGFRFHQSSPLSVEANFGELAKEWLEAAALIQKAQAKPTQNFKKHYLQRYHAWGRWGGSQGNTGPSRGRNWQVGGSKAGTSKKS